MIAANTGGVTPVGGFAAERGFQSLGTEPIRLTDGRLSKEDTKKMSLRINFNAAALQAHRQLSGTDNALGKSIERLSSGFKINSAGDDPAGLVISEKLRAQVGGLGQAIRNAGDAVNMVKTAEGALNEVHSLLRSMRDLAVHAANTGATDAPSVAADQAQITNAIASINNIASETQFGNKTLLDGSAGILATPTGSAVTAADLSAATVAADTTVGVNVTTAATQASITGTADMSGGTTGDWTVTINGVDVALANGTSQANIAAAINNVTDQTGVVASTSGNFIQLDQLSYGSTNRIDVTGANANDVFGATSLAAIGIDAAATVTDGAAANVSDASWTAGTGTVLQDSLGNTISLTDAAAAVASDKGTQLNVEVGTLTFQVGAFANQTRTLSIGSVSSGNLGTTAVSGETLATVNVTSGTGAQEAIQILDEAISDISTLRASLGATQKNVLESSINSLTIAKENIGASESTIRDTDMAAEMVSFTKYQILQQAGVAMLAQANQAPQALLSLLR